MNSDAADLIELVQRLGQPRVLVIGDLMLDRYIWGDAERISQEAPVAARNDWAAPAASPRFCACSAPRSPWPAWSVTTPTPAAFARR
jgi:hypothetical protein